MLGFEHQAPLAPTSPLPAPPTTSSVPRATYDAHLESLLPLRTQGRLVVMSEGAGDTPDVLSHMKTNGSRLVSSAVRGPSCMPLLLGCSPGGRASAVAAANEALIQQRTRGFILSKAPISFVIL